MKRENRQKILQELRSLRGRFLGGKTPEYTHRGYYIESVNNLRGTGEYNYSSGMYCASIRIRPVYSAESEAGTVIEPDDEQRYYHMDDLYLYLDHGMDQTKIWDEAKKEIDSHLLRSAEAMGFSQ